MAARVFYTDNDTESLADALKAVGVAQALRGWLRALELPTTPIWIEDKGGYHIISLPAELDVAAADAVSGAVSVEGPQPLLSKSELEKAAKAGRALAGFDYEHYKANRDSYFKQYLSRPAAERKQIDASPDGDAIKQLAPPQDFALYAYINQFKAASGYNALLAQWRAATPATLRANLRFLARAYAETANPVDQALAQWTLEATDGASVKPVTRLQLINPTTGKGANAPKAGALSIGGLDGFWLVEYLEFVGLFTLATPLVVKGSKDRKTYVLRPVKVELGAIEGVMQAFRAQARRATAVKLDIVTALSFAATLIGYLRDAMQAQQPDPLLALFGQRRRVTDIARGFDVAFYKDMGSAFATMNLATVNLPGWLEQGAQFATPAEADRILALLDEHQLVIASIRTTKGDEGSDEYELLRRYRDFFSGHDLLGFFDFAARYGDYLLAKRLRSQWASQFTTEGLDSLMTQQAAKFGPIIENEGFRAIATAIRQATVIAQYRSARGRDTRFPYETRYGLGQELLRAAAYPQAFLAALGTFIQSYNAENARMDERIQNGSLAKTYRRKSVQVAQLDQLVRLIDAYNGDSELICKLLVAYGYARDPRAPGEPTEQGNGPADEQESSDDND